jgi:hypothetical protein
MKKLLILSMSFILLLVAILLICFAKDTYDFKKYQENWKNNQEEKVSKLVEESLLSETEVRTFFKKYELLTSREESNIKYIKRTSTDEIEMKVDMYCGQLCGEGKLYKFKKINGNWEVESEETLWVS